MNNAVFSRSIQELSKNKKCEKHSYLKIKLTTFKTCHINKVVSMIDTVLTIVGGFSRFTLIKFFLRCKSERCIFYFSIFLVRNAKKKN